MTQDFSSLLDSDPKEDLAIIKAEGNIAQWSHEKKKDFAAVFDARTRTARFLLAESAQHIVRIAFGRHFIGRQHILQVFPDAGNNLEYFIDNRNYNFNQQFVHTLLDQAALHGPAKIGGRPLADLEKIAEERSEAILKELPPIKQAVAVIDPKTAAKMDRRDQLLEKGRELSTKLEEISEPIKLSEVDADMTIGEFRKSVRDRERRRAELVKRLNEIGREGSDLEDTINKALFKGLPGLAEAVVDIAKNHLERATMFDQFNRRVGEQVLFGDSEQAMELLRKFEADEKSLSKDLKTQLQSALEKLKLSKPQLASKKK